MTNPTLPCKLSQKLASHAFFAQEMEVQPAATINPSPKEPVL